MAEITESTLFRPDILAGKVALVTGGGTGIGAGITRMLADHGADIVLASRRRSHLEPMAGEVQALPHSLCAVQLARLVGLWHRSPW